MHQSSNSLLDQVSPRAFWGCWEVHLTSWWALQGKCEVFHRKWWTEWPCHIHATHQKYSAFLKLPENMPIDYFNPSFYNSLLPHLHFNIANHRITFLPDDQLCFTGTSDEKLSTKKFNSWWGSGEWWWQWGGWGTCQETLMVLIAISLINELTPSLNVLESVQCNTLPWYSNL